MTSRRAFTATLLTCAVAGMVVLLAAGRVWKSGQLVSVTGARMHVDVTGHAAEPALPALGIALVVLAAGILAARGWLRRGVGLVVVVVGAAVVALSVTSRTDAVRELRKQAFAVANMSVPATLSGWAVLSLVCGVVAAVAGAVTVVAGGRWPGLGRRYDAPSAGATDRAPTDWEALDRGEDPTV